LRREKNQGFTLIELVVVLAILGIMVAIAVPNFKQYMFQRRLNGAARQIMSDLMSARMKAITQNRKVKVFISGNNHQYTVCDDANGDGIVSNGEGTVQVRDIQYDYPGVTYTATVPTIFCQRDCLRDDGYFSKYKRHEEGGGSTTGRVKIE